ncbi:hypothetical protein [Flavobacterium sp. ASV13]|uniref:hypothetical protein n=1 Tax=Flavobacterium sp. ASV13 TaxID=1506583 RepID=UPI00054E46CF|nr:hypothetical protein [Flavobacterium sp. ASV13]
MKNIAVITTKFVLEKKSPIVSVFRDDDGDWQFFGKEEDIQEEDARVISLDEILKIDDSINDILWINNGMHAWRENKNEKWNIDL